MRRKSKLCFRLNWPAMMTEDRLQDHSSEEIVRRVDHPGHNTCDMCVLLGKAIADRSMIGPGRRLPRAEACGKRLLRLRLKGPRKLAEVVQRDKRA
jgi:hypothetical protein